MKIGYFLSSEDYTPAELLAQARGAEEAGFERCGFPTTTTRGWTPRVRARSSGR